MGIILDEHLIKHAYDNTITYAARLSLLATGTEPKSDGPIAEKQTMLGLDDLASFAYHARRLIDLTQTKHLFKAVEFKALKTNEKLKLLKTLSVIIHQEFINIIRTEYELRLAAGHDPIKSLIEYSQSDKKTIQTLVSVKSDKSNICVFKLEEFIETFQSKILSKIIDKCENDGLYLEEY